MSTEQTSAAVETEEIVDDFGAGAPDLTNSPAHQSLPSEIPAKPLVEFDDTSHADDLESDPAAAPGADAAAEVLTPEIPEASDATVPGDQGAEAPDAGATEPEFTQSLLDAAGVTVDQAKELFQTPSALENAVRMLDQRFVQTGYQLRATQAQPPAHLAPPPDPAPAPTPTPQSGALQKFQIPKPKDGQDWDEDTKFLFEQLNDHYYQQQQQLAGQLQSQNSFLTTMAQERARQAEVDYVTEFDNFVDKLGPGFEPLLGKGSGFEIPRQSLAFQNRLHLDQVAASLEAGLKAHGQNIPRSQILERAVRVAFPQQQEQAIRTAAKKEVTEAIEKRQGMITARPSARKGSKLTADARAAATVEKFFKDRGIHDPMSDNNGYAEEI